MNIHDRKLEFIQDFLKLQSEETISQFEKLLKKTKNSELGSQPSPFTIEQLNERILKSEDDFKNNKFKTTSELLSKY
ncbi:hypothetical protein [Chryseobacterium chendengshani]|uniref:hypothetical protein n=1 Tax=Chryseobacterium sp. LJ756 TaxID=2864113 RepID=UPI001C63DA86|nr:hypothetical protein [Chryseobacterium sp. LJ756]MBW7675462.1 hypothetical protein [Chryseobacterium sp. LJ756]